MKKNTEGKRKSCRNIKILDKCRNLCKSKRWRMAVLFLLGGMLIASGIGLHYKNRVRKIPAWSKEGPLIEVACDKPEKEISISSLTEEEGKTTLTFFSNDGSRKQYHVWVYVSSDPKAPVAWSIHPEAGNVENCMGTLWEEKTAEVEPSGKYSGLATRTMFKITFGGSDLPMAEIQLAEQKDRAVYRENGIYRPRLPRIRPWNVKAKRYAQKGLIDSSGVYYKYAETGGKEPYGPDINDEKMYCPDLDIGGTYANASAVLENDLELSVVSPDTESQYPALWWRKQMFFEPLVQFQDRKWEADIKRNNLIGGLLIGLGVNVCSALAGYVFRNRQVVRK